MNPDEYSRMYELEDRYWWYRGRRTLAFALLFSQKLCPKPLILDLGCGTGVVTKGLAERGEPVGVDMSPLALNYARTRGDFALVGGDGTALPFHDETFDAAIGLDVFEHIEDDIGALRECARCLKPGGFLVLSVPAFKALWGPHDVALHHFRRYRKREVGDRLRQAGLEPVKISYSVFFLFPIVWLVRLFEKRKTGPAQASLPKVPEWLNRFLVGVQAAETSLIRLVSLPWGSSVVAVARKPIGSKTP